LEENRKASNKKYEGPNLTIQGVKFLDSGTLVELITALKDTQHPFLAKIAGDVALLSLQQPHPELPELATTATSSPLPILETESRVSTVSSQSLYQTEAPSFAKFTTPYEPDTLAFPLVRSVEYAITIGRDCEFKVASYLAQSFFLAKELLSLSLQMAYERDYWKLVQDLRMGTLLNHQNQPVSEQEKRKVGSSLFYNQLGDPNSTTWKSIDSLPVILLGNVGKEIAAKGIFSKKDDTITGIFSNSSGEISKDSQLNTQVSQFVNRWTASGLLLPTYDLVKESAQGKLFEASLKTQTTVK